MKITGAEAKILNYMNLEETLYYSTARIVKHTGLSYSWARKALIRLTQEQILKTLGTARQETFSLGCFVVPSKEAATKREIAKNEADFDDEKSRYLSFAQNGKTLFTGQSRAIICDSERQKRDSILFSEGLYIYSYIYDGIQEKSTQPMRRRVENSGLQKARADHQGFAELVDLSRHQGAGRKEFPKLSREEYQTIQSMAKKMGDFIKGWKGHVDRDLGEQWMSDFAKMLSKDKIPATVLENVLTWYIDQRRRRNNRLPKSITSGALFRKHFAWIFGQYEPPIEKRSMTKAVGITMKWAKDYSDLDARRIPGDEVLAWMLACDEYFRALRRKLMEFDVLKQHTRRTLTEMTDPMFLGRTVLTGCLRNMLATTERWDGWKRSLEQFYPREYYFKEYLNRLCHSRWGRWLNQTEQGFLDRIS